jgi:hypothetical protein
MRFWGTDAGSCGPRPRAHREQRGIRGLSFFFRLLGEPDTRQPRHDSMPADLDVTGSSRTTE